MSCRRLCRATPLDIQDLQTYRNFLDLSTRALVDKEVAALSALMAHIARYDTTNRVVMVQIENEPDGAGAITQGVDWGSPKDMAAKMFAGGQFEAASALLNTLGNVVHRSPRRIVTRCNIGTPYRALDYLQCAPASRRRHRYRRRQQLFTGPGPDEVRAEHYSGSRKRFPSAGRWGKRFQPGRARPFQL